MNFEDDDIKIEDNDFNEDELTNYYDEDNNDDLQDEFSNQNNIDLEDDDDELSNNDIKKIELKRKLIKLMMFIGGAMLILLLLLYIMSKLGTKTYTYEDVEKIMQKAAEDYYSQNSSNLPKDNSSNIEISVDSLVSNGNMKSIDEYLGQGHGCTGKVQVKKTPNSYVYTPYLNCGENYNTKFLSDTIANDANLVSSGYGLYLLNNNYVFRGEEVNNYVELEASTWRIVKVNADKTITLIKEYSANYRYPYDDRYNSEAGHDYGYNTYATSRIKERLEKMYESSDEYDREYYLFTEKDKSHLVKFDICTGKINPKEKIHNNSLECSQSTSGIIGLLTVSDYVNASIDTNCDTVSSESCANYNYLATNGSFWLVTPGVENSYSNYLVSGGSIIEIDSNDYNYVRPVITLAANTLISGGDGTKDNPYKVK